MPFQIRAARKDDEDDWRRLWDQYNEFLKRTISEEVTSTTFARMLDNGCRMYCSLAINENDQIVGFVHWLPQLSTFSVEETIYLHDMFVDPSSQGGGTGRRLIDHVYEQAKIMNAKSVYWHTQWFNHRAQILYVKMADRTDNVHYRKTFF